MRKRRRRRRRRRYGGGGRCGTAAVTAVHRNITLFLDSVIAVAVIVVAVVVVVVVMVHHHHHHVMTKGKRELVLKRRWVEETYDGGCAANSDVIGSDREAKAMRCFQGYKAFHDHIATKTTKNAIRRDAKCLEVRATADTDKGRGSVAGHGCGHGSQFRNTWCDHITTLSIPEAIVVEHPKLHMIHKT